MIQKTFFIFYVSDQTKSAHFYECVLDQKPALNVPGMTEFQLSETSSLGLMPNAGIKTLLGPLLPDPELAKGVPRAELYLITKDPQVFLDRALSRGATLLSPLQKRNWGDIVAYCLDYDGHVLAFAQQNS